MGGLVVNVCLKRGGKGGGGLSYEKGVVWVWGT